MLDWIETCIKNDFGLEADRLRLVCLDLGESALPYGAHVQMAMDIAGLDSADERRDVLVCVYMYLFVVYHMIDAENDGHPFQLGSSAVLVRAGDQALFLLAIVQRLRIISSTVTDPPFERIIVLFREALIENGKALKEEARYNSSPLTEFILKEEFFHLWGRSNIFLFLVDLCGLLSARTTTDEIRSMVKQALFLTQMADDLADWKVDYAAGNWTPFLRRCVGQVGRLLPKNDLEEFILLSGFLEEELIFLTNGFSNLSSELCTLSIYPIFQRKVEKEGEKMKAMLVDLVSTKLLANAAYQPAS